MNQNKVTYTIFNRTNTFFGFQHAGLEWNWKPSADPQVENVISTVGCQLSASSKLAGHY